MTTVELKENLSDVADDFPVFVKTINGYEHIELAYEEVLFSDNTPHGAEKDAFLLFPRQPKYDPFRLFKKGDRVRVVERYGRKFWSAAPETIYTVVEDEYLHDDQNVLLRGCVGINDGKPETLSAWNIPFFHLELVTPVEDLDPYSVEGDEDEWHILRCGKFLMSFPFDSSAYYTEEQAKAAAEAECDRLNAEYRKEQNNG
jgi:hypothetical protein